MAVQKSSFVSLMEDVSMLNRNTVEIIAKLNDVVSSTESTVQFTIYKPDGSQYSFNMPTVGYLKTQIDAANNNIKRLSGFENNTSLMIDGKSVKRIFTTDLNNEPNPISYMGMVKTFEPINNHFFEGLTNPLLAIDIDLKDKVNEDTNGILSRRYIVNFERNIDNSLTTNGMTSYNDFKTRFLNRSDIGISEFTDWYYNTTNYGVVIDTVEPYDEQIFDISLKKLQYHGLFSIIKSEIDSVNKKYWYHLNTLNYYGIDGSTKNLSTGNELILNKLNSSTRWVIKEINTENSLNKVVLERVDGYDPVPIGVDMLKYYSDTSNNKSVKVTVGFEEYNILFIKPINTQNHLVSNVWSKGMCYYTNDLMLSTNQNIRLSEYYIKTVYDYGKILEDMVLKKIPTKYGQQPNKAILDSNNFKVVQINTHLTDTSNSDVLKNLQSQKITSKTKLSEYDNTIIEKNQELNSNLTTSEMITVQNELNNSYNLQSSETKNLTSIVSKISSITNTVTATPKYRARGFWYIPDPIISNQSEPQHVVQFITEYRYSSKDGKTPSVQSFPFTQANNNTISATSQTSSVGTNVSTTSESPTTNTAYFSTWNRIISDVRKRYWDEVKGNWYWKIEDVSNADTPNINQLDIPIQPNEKIEIRVKSISEVGWPDSVIESDWSDIFTIEFPDNLSSIVDNNEFILKEASQDQTLVSVTNELNAKGVYTHIKDSYYNGQEYFPHVDRNIAVTFKDDNGNTMNLYEYLLMLNNRISNLDAIVSRAKGELKVTLNWVDTNQNSHSYTIQNNDTKTIVIECEDHATKSGVTRSYLNELYLYDNYYLLIENASTSNPMGLLSSRLYEVGGTYNNTFYKYPGSKAVVIDQNDGMNTQNDNQFIWFSDNTSNNMIYSGSTNLTWESKRETLRSTSYNLGTSEIWSGDTLISDTGLWNEVNGSSDFSTTVHPIVNEMNDIIDTGQSKVKIIDINNTVRINIGIYFKLNISGGTNVFSVPTSIGVSPSHTKKLKVFIEPENSSKPFEFELVFGLRQYRGFSLVGTVDGGTGSDINPDTGGSSVV